MVLERDGRTPRSLTPAGGASSLRAHVETAL
jgi:hypothetical protein